MKNCESDCLKGIEKLWISVTEDYAMSIMRKAGAFENEFIRGLILIGVKPTQILYAALYTDVADTSKIIVHLCEKANEKEEVDE